MKILVVGAGAMGGYFGARLVEKGYDVDFMVRDNYVDILNEKGIVLEGTEEEQIKVKVNACTQDRLGDVVYDVVIIAVKSWAVTEVCESIKPWVNSDTVVVSLQNGIAHINALLSNFSKDNLVFTIPVISATLVGVGHIKYHSGTETVYVGTFDDSRMVPGSRVMELLNIKGLNPLWCSDIKAAQWAKLSAHCGASLFCMTRTEKSPLWRIKQFKSLYYEAVEEAISVGTAMGVDNKAIREYQKGILADCLPSNWKPSTLIALENKKRLEIDALNGYVSLKGKDYGVSTPVNDIIYTAVLPYIKGGFA